MKMHELDEAVGRIVKGVNTTVDVGPNEIKIQAAKFGNTVDKDGCPPTMSKAVKGSSTNVLYNLGLAERYTPMEIACIEGGHCLEDLKELRPSVPKKPGRLFVSLTEGYKLQLERDRNILVLNIVDNATGKRTEVRGKPGYETDGYNANDPLHKLLDVVGKSANISELMNGEVVTINPKHPDAARALAATDRAYNEAFDTDVEWIKGAAPQGASVFAAKVDDAYIEITYKPVSKGVYISFTRGARMSVTGEGSQNKIFGAVINHIKKWVDTNKPQEIYFSAFKPRTGAFGSQDTTRSGLYRKMVQRFASQNGYDYDVEDGGNEDTFILKRRNVEESSNGKEIAVHRSSEKFSNIDLSKSADGTFWLAAPDADWDNIVTTGKGVEHAYEISPNAKLASWDDIDKYSIDELENMGYDGVRMVDGKDISYQIWNTDILSKTELGENFADGKKPGRKGLAKRSGVNTKASVSSLRKTAKNSSGEKQRMAHWLANMKAGRAKKK